MAVAFSSVLGGGALEFPEVAAAEASTGARNAAASAALAAGTPPPPPPPLGSDGAGEDVEGATLLVVLARVAAAGGGGGAEGRALATLGVGSPPPLPAPLAAPPPPPPPPPPLPSLALARARFASKCPPHLPAAAATLRKWARGPTNGMVAGVVEAEADPEAAAAALATLSDAIREAAEEEGDCATLVALTPSLLAALFALENAAAWPAFEGWRAAALRALLVCAAPLAAAGAIARVTARDVGEGARSEAMEALGGAAWELGGRPGAALATPPPPWLDPSWAPPAVDDAPGAAGERAAAEARLRAARGVGEAPRAAEPAAAEPAALLSTALAAPFGAAAAAAAAATTNLFAPLCEPYFFWPLLRAIGGGRGGSGGGGGGGGGADALFLIRPELGGGDAGGGASGGGGGGSLGAGSSGAPVSLLDEGRERLLGEALRTLALFLEAASGFSAGATGALWRAAWALRAHAHGGVRLGAIVALAACVAAVARGGEEALLGDAFDPSAAGGGGGDGGSVPAPLLGATTSALRLPLEGLSGGSALRLPLGGPSGGGLLLSQQRGISGGVGGAEAEALLKEAALLMGTRRVWDDVVECVAWLRGVVGGAEEGDAAVRRAAGDMLASGVLQALVLGPPEDG